MNRSNASAVCGRMCQLMMQVAGAGIVALPTCLGSGALAGGLTVVEPGWTVIREIAFDNPSAARINPMDNRIYVGRRDTSLDGLYRIDSLGFSVRLATASNPAGLCIDPTTGHVFQAEDFGGNIYRTQFGTTGRTTWVSGFHSGDDDPTGIAIAPLNYTGPALLPGQAIVADRGFNGLDEVWIWSPATAEGEVVLVPDGPLVDAVDVAIDANAAFVIDTMETQPGRIYAIGSGGALTEFITSQPIAEPTGIAIDPMNGDLLIMDSAAQQVVRVNRDTGNVTAAFINVGPGVSWSGLSFTEDGRQLIVTSFSEDVIHVLGRCDASRDPELDCNGNRIADFCEIVMGDASDCNGNGVPDACDIALGTSEDCNNDGVPDECAICPQVEVVFIMDTSTSMNDEASALCNGILQMTANLEAAGLTVSARYLGICDAPGGSFGCLEGSVAGLLGTTVPGQPPVNQETMGACPGGNEVCQEDWGRAVSVVAGAYNWQPLTESVRLIIPIADEGPWCGDPVNANDNGSITHAIAVAQANNVIVSPITGTGSSGAMIALAQQLANATGGQQFASSTPSVDIAESIVELVLAACAAASDCNDNGFLDTCDINEGRSVDENGNGVPDECEVTPGDLDNDGDIDDDDRASLCAIMGVGVGAPGFNVAADINHDNVIDHLDLGLFNLLQPTCGGDLVTSATFEPPPDSVVNAADLAYLLGAWGVSPSCADIVTSATFQPPPDGVVDAADLAFLLGAWGQCDR
jgi:hypothetical protein